MGVDSSKLVRLFDSWAETFDSDIAVSEWGFEGYNDGIEWVRRQLEYETRCDKVIDLGCGTGTLAERLRQSTVPIEYLGIDICPKMIQIAGAKSPTSSFIQTDIRDFSNWESCLETPGNCTVVSTYCLHHLDDEEKIGLIRRIFSANKKQDLRILIVDYAFLNSAERDRILHEQIMSGNYHIKEEVESEYYADLDFIKNALVIDGLELSFEKNGIWDWRISVQRCRKPDIHSIYHTDWTQKQHPQLQNLQAY
jgi:SAM-dependent methyltransferase